MIQEFRVRNFLSFKQEQVLSFVPTADSTLEDQYCIFVNEHVRLLKTAFIYGANGSGKTNLLSAINFLKRIVTKALNNNNDSVGIDQFLLDDTSNQLSSFFSIIFYLERKKYIYEIELNNNTILKEELIYYPGIRRTRLYSRFYDPDTAQSVIDFGNHVKLNKNDAIIIQGNTLNNSTVLATLSKVNVANSILNDVFNYFQGVIQNILAPDHDMDDFLIKKIENDKNCKDAILEFLKKGGFNISGLDVEKEEMEVTPEMRKVIENIPFNEEERKNILDKGKIENKRLILFHKTTSGIYNLSSDVQSRGTMRYLGMLALLYKLVHEDSVMCVDEIESSLHYTLLQDFIRLFLENGKNQSQLIFSTHDINILDEDFIRRDVVWFTEKNVDGETILERLSSKGIHKNVSIYNAYKRGRI